MRATRRRGGKIRRQFSVKTIAEVKAVAQGCNSMRELIGRVEKLGISEHDLYRMEQEWRVRFPRANPKTRRAEAKPECIHPRNPANPGFGRTSPA